MESQLTKRGIGRELATQKNCRPGLLPTGDQATYYIE